MRTQRGTTTVEFAIIGTLLMILLLAIIEFGRAMFVMNTLTEATRRGVRVAVVCPVNDPAPARVAVFANGSGESRIIRGLGVDNIVIEYLNATGGVVGDPGVNFGDIRFVRTRIVNFTHDLIIPVAMPTILMPPFAATLPRESLGVPREGAVEPC